MKHAAIPSLIFAAALAGCSAQSIVATVGGVTPEQIATAPRRQMTPAEIGIVEAVVARGLKDPMSAQFRHSPLVVLKNQNGGSVYCPAVNARNSYGGYVGFSAAYVVVFTDAADKVTEAKLIALDAGGETSTAELCAARGYAS